MTTADASPREVLSAIRAQRELRRAETAQVARLHQVALPLSVSERRLKAGFDRMLNGLEGLDELEEVQLRIVTKGHLDGFASKTALNALGWLVAERGLVDLCLSLYAGGADVEAMLEGAIVGGRLATVDGLLSLRPSLHALQLAMEACLVADALDAAHLVHRSGAVLDDAAAAAVSLNRMDWVQQLLAWGAAPDAVLVQAAFDGNTFALKLALARGARATQEREGLLLAEIAWNRGHPEAAALLSDGYVRNG